MATKLARMRTKTPLENLGQRERVCLRSMLVVTAVWGLTEVRARIFDYILNPMEKRLTHKIPRKSGLVVSYDIKKKTTTHHPHM